MINENDFKTLVDWSELRAFNGLWNCISSDLILSLEFTGNEIPFEKRKELFFYFVYRLLKEGRLKLAKNGHLLGGSIDDQIKLFYEAFPKTENGMFDKQKLMDDYWFFDDSCPVEAVWVLEDGSLEWT